MSKVQRTWLTATFWLDTLERVVAIFISTLLAVLIQQQDWPSGGAWKAIGIACAIRLLLCMGAAFVGEPGTASVMNPAPPDTLKADKDKGALSFQDLIVVTAIAVLAAVVLYFIIT